MLSRPALLIAYAPQKGLKPSDAPEVMKIALPFSLSKSSFSKCFINNQLADKFTFILICQSLSDKWDKGVRLCK